MDEIRPMVAQIVLLGYPTHTCIHDPCSGCNIETLQSSQHWTIMCNTLVYICKYLQPNLDLLSTTSDVRAPQSNLCNSTANRRRPCLGHEA